MYIPPREQEKPAEEVMPERTPETMYEREEDSDEGILETLTRTFREDYEW